MVCLCSSVGQVTRVGEQQSVENLNSTSKENYNKWEKTYKTQMDPITDKACRWAAPEYDATGEGIDRALWIAAQVALMAAQIALNTFVSNKEYDIAKGYADGAKEKWNYFKGRYASLERKLLAEASGTAEPPAAYGDAQTRGRQAVAAAFAQAQTQLKAKAKSYALCMDSALTLDHEQSVMHDDTVNFNYRDTENFKDYKSDKRWNRRSDILNLGRGNAATAFSFAKSAASAFSSFAAAVNQAGNGLQGFIGYMSNRFSQTQYPNINQGNYQIGMSLVTNYGNMYNSVGGSMSSTR